MRKTLLILCTLAALTLSAGLSAAPFPAAPAPLAFLTATPSFTPASPTVDFSPPLWTVAGGNCWAYRQSCIAACDPQDSFCALTCECDYCTCARLEPPQECSFNQN
jgi:hypothetical protein